MADDDQLYQPTFGTPDPAQPYGPGYASDEAIQESPTRPMRVIRDDPAFQAPTGPPDTVYQPPGQQQALPTQPAPQAPLQVPTVRPPSISERQAGRTPKFEGV